MAALVPRSLAFALKSTSLDALLAVEPYALVVALVASLVALFVAWRRHRWAGWLWPACCLACVASLMLPAPAEPLAQLRFASPLEATSVGDDEQLLAVRIGDNSRAYPLRVLARNRIVEDKVGGVELLALAHGTCHATHVWGREVDGNVLHFRAIAAQGEDYLLRDTETGSTWRPANGLAIAGPLSGKQLASIHSDELSFGVWDDEAAAGSVLLPAGAAPLARRDDLLVHRIEQAGEIREYAHREVVRDKLKLDEAGGERFALLTAIDGTSARAFLLASAEESRFERKEELGGGLLVDFTSGGEWNFQGCPVPARENAACLPQLRLIRSCRPD